MSVAVGLLTVVVSAIIYLAWKNRRPPGLPPGPPHVPFLGSLLSVKLSNLSLQIHQWTAQYGDLFTMSMGNRQLVVLGSFDVIKEAFVNHGIEFAGRDPPGIRDELINPKLPIRGIALSTYSEEWRRQRSTALHILRDLGYGKHSIDEKIQAECHHLREVFNGWAGKPGNPVEYLNIAICNVICSLLFGERYDYSDVEFKQLLADMEAASSILIKCRMAEFIPVLQLRPSFQQHCRTAKALNKSITDFHDRKIAERLSQLQERSYADPSDFIEHYLTKVHKQEKGEGDGHAITENWLPRIVSDFFFAGTDTTLATMSWAFLLLAVNPDIQQKLQAELDRFLKETGSQEFHFKDREKLPYVEATACEVQRFSSVAGFSLSHRTTSPVQLRGYCIPEDTSIVANLRAVLHDPSLWPQPDCFRPERFLDDQGRVLKPEHWIPFSIGRRSCLGEQLARQEIFTILATITHSFHISLPDGTPVPDLHGVHSITVKPAPHTLCFLPRL